MAEYHITDKNTLKSWFQRGLKPLASQFAAWMDSYWHKEEKIPSASVAGLEEALNAKAETVEVDSKVDIQGGEMKDTVVHFSTAGERVNIESGETQATLFGKVRRWFADLGSLAFASYLPDLTFKSGEREWVYDGTEDVVVDLQNEFNYLTMDLNLMDESNGLNADALRNAVRDQVKAFNDPLKPCIVSVQSSQRPADKESMIVFPTGRGYYKYSFQLTNHQLLTKLSDFLIVFTYYPEEDEVYFDFIKGGLPVPEEVIFLVLLGNGILSINDMNAGAVEGIYGLSWNLFGQRLKLNHHPAVFLKTDHSESFQPVKYYFSRDGHGTMEIQYVKENRLVTERMEFTDFPGNGAIYERTQKEYDLQPAKNVIQIDLANVVDLSVWYQDSELLTAVGKQILQVEDWSKPLKVVVRNFLGTEYVVQVFRFQDASTDSVRRYTLTVSLPDALFYMLKMKGIQIDVVHTSNEMTTTIVPAFEQRNDLILLYENGNGMLDAEDELKQEVYAVHWVKFQEAIENGLHPAVYLCSAESGCFCPVSYTYEKDVETSKWHMEMSISYYKEMPSGMELWIEKRVFQDGVRQGCLYNDGIGIPVITKHQLVPLD